MNIADLLAEAAEEHYEQHFDEFEKEEEDINQVIVDSNTGEIDHAATLQLAAQVIAKEDREDAHKILSNVAEDMSMDILKRSYDNNPTDGLAEKILLEASEEVADYYEDNHIIEKREEDIQSTGDETEKEEEPESGADSEEDEPDDPELNTQLIIACYREKVETIKQLLRKGAVYNSRDRHGWTPLMWACSRGYNEVAEVLIDTCLAKKKSVRRYVNSADSITGWTALHLACINGHKHTVELLLRNKANKKLKNLMKEMPIECIGKGPQSRNIRILLGEQ